MALASWLVNADFDQKLWLCTDMRLSEQCDYLLKMDLVGKVKARVKVIEKIC